MIRVMIVDDQQIVREGLKMILSLDGGIETVHEAANGFEAIDYLKENPCDVVLMDIKMPVLNGVDATEKIKALYPDLRILVLTTFNDDEFIFSALKNGADGYLLKDAGSGQIIDAIKTVYQKKVFLHPDVALKVVAALKSGGPPENAAPADLSLLTAREREVAALVSMGKSNREICNKMFVTEGTVKNHITSILDKLELKNRTELALYMKNNDPKHDQNHD